MNRRPNYEEDAATFPADAYTVAGWRAGIAFVVRGWETELVEDTDWSGYENRTGRVVVTMIGDDARHVVDVDDLTPLDELAYCASCGQIRCANDGRDRDEEDDDAAELARQRAEDERLPIQPEGHE